MFKYLLAYVLFSPLIGIILIENGAPSIDTAELGHPNGASLAYAAHCIVLLAVTLLAIKKMIGSRKAIKTASFGLPRFVPLAYMVLAFNLLFLVVMMFGAGGIAVLRGQVIKQEFRASLDYMGAISRWITFYFAPSLLAYLSFVFTKSSKSPKEHFLLALNFAVCSSIGLNWGFKSTAITVLFPSLLIIYWKISFRKVLALALIASVFLTGAFVLFDREDEGLAQGVTMLAIRATVIQGDVSWSMWDMYKDNQKFPRYLPTLYAAMGDRLFSLFFGIEKRDYMRWVGFHYDLMLTELSNVPLQDIAGGHTVTGTVFSEGVIALGSPWYLCFSVFAGLCVGIFYNILESALINGRAILTSLASTYFCSILLLGWLNGGGVTQLFHISVFIGLLMACGLIRVCQFFTNRDRTTLPFPSRQRAKGPAGPLLQSPRQA